MRFSLQAARDYLETKHHLTIPQDTPVEQLSVKRKVYFEGSEGVAKIVYQVQFFVGLAPTPCRPFFLFDACDPGLDVVVYFDKVSALRPLPSELDPSLLSESDPSLLSESVPSLLRQIPPFRINPLPPFRISSLPSESDTSLPPESVPSFPNQYPLF